jgi:predicted HicB family RNase H-like nuclease
MYKEHGNTGNKYAKKLNPLTASINNRCLASDKERWENAAKKMGISLSQWVVINLNRSLENDL